MGVEIKTGFWYDGGAEARKCVEWGLGNCVIGLSSPEDAAYCREKGFYLTLLQRWGRGVNFDSQGHPQTRRKR